LEREIKDGWLTRCGESAEESKGTLGCQSEVLDNRVGSWDVGLIENRARLRFRGIFKERIVEKRRAKKGKFYICPSRAIREEVKNHEILLPRSKALVSWEEAGALEDSKRPGERGEAHRGHC